MKIKKISYLLLINIFLFNPVNAAVNKATDETKPVLFYADSQTYDRDLGILILKGNVEFDHQGNVLEADMVTYNENSDLVTASGNVRLRQADGDINFVEYLELTGDMKEGVLLQLRTLLEDDSKIVAIEGRKFEDRQELDQAVYTPCELCGDKRPTWQINARKATKDDVNKDIHFRDADFRILDVPIFYLPYATQPLERRSGFLIPQPLFISDFGPGIQTPYYLALPESDITLAPYFFTEQSPVLMGQYRKFFGSGFFQVDGSITNYKKSQEDIRAERANLYKIPETRGHVYADGILNINDIWRAELSGGYVSDKTYFRKYKISGWQNEPVLTSEGLVEGFLNQRDYAAGKTYYFQGLQTTDIQERIPVVLPMLEYSAYTAKDPWGGRFTFDGNLLNLYREKGINMQRAIGSVGWRRPWIIQSGQVFSVFGSARGDLYNIENQNDRAARLAMRNQDFFNDRQRDGGARFFPQAGLDWKWPFAAFYGCQSFIVQPVAQLIGAPKKDIGLAQRRIPNEDSTDFELNDANLFSSNRFPGYDRIDLGSRVVYGGEFLTTGSWFGDLDIFLGQSYSFTNKENPFLNSGLNHKASDYVGRIEASPLSWLTLNYRFRLDEETLDHRLAEVGGSIGPAIANLSGDYLFLNRVDRARLVNQPVSQLANINQVNITLSSQFTKYWTIKASLLQNLNSKKEQGGVLQHGIGLFYRDDCFGLGVTVQRQYFQTRDVKPATIIMFNLFLKNIGDFSTSFNMDTGPLGNYTNRRTNTLAP